jgi:hypothetical protein
MTLHDEQKQKREQTAETVALWINNTKKLLDLARTVATYDPKKETVQYIAGVHRDRERLLAEAIREINKTLDHGEHLDHTSWERVAPHLLLET